MCEVRSRKNGQERKKKKKKEKKSTVVSSKKKWTVMNPIRRRMKKHKASSGQNGQLVHWWLLVHSGRNQQHQQVLGFYVPFARVQNCWAKTILWSQTGMFWHFFHLKFSVYCTSEVVTHLRIIHNWIIMGIQWMVHWWVLVHCGLLFKPELWLLEMNFQFSLHIFNDVSTHDL